MERFSRWSLQACGAAVSVLAVLVFSQPLMAQGAPINGTALLSAPFTQSTATLGQASSAKLLINVTSVTGQGPGGTTPAVLAAYQVTVTFDQTRLRLNSVTGGTSSGYTGSPTTSSISSANATGNITIVGDNGGNSGSPTGAVTVATLSFTTINTGTAAVTVSPESLSSSIQGATGPANIPGTGSSSSVTISTMGGGNPGTDLPGVPRDPSPADHATNVAAPVTLSWVDDNATSYDVFFGLNPNPTTKVGTTTSPTFAVATSPNTVYYWEITARNDSGPTIGPSWTFTTGGSSCSTPAAPVLSVPAEGFSSTPYTVSWGAISGATEYQIDESTDPNFASNVSTTVVTAPATSAIFNHSVMTDTTYYYRIRTRINASGCDVLSDNSAVASIVVSSNARRIIPVVASQPGNFGSVFETSLQISNPTDATISGFLIFHVEGVSGSDTDPALAYALTPGKTESFSDILPAMGLAGLKGSMDLVATSGAPPAAVVRLFNDAGANGTSGMNESLVSLPQALQTGDSVLLIAPIDPTTARLNIGVRSLHSGANLTFVLRDSNGNQLATVTKSYPSDYFQQLSDSDLLGMAAPANGTVTVTVNSGTGLVYGATTDDTTNDPAMQLPLHNE